MARTIFVSEVLLYLVKNYNMRSLFAWFILGLATITTTFASDVTEEENVPEISALVSFPENNPFGRKFISHIHNWHTLTAHSNRHRKWRTESYSNTRREQLGTECHSGLC